MRYLGDEVPQTSEVMESIPVGSRAYIQADMILGSGVDRLKIRESIGVLARAHAREELVPPIPEPLGQVLTKISDIIEAEENEHMYDHVKPNRHVVGAELLNNNHELSDAALLAARAIIYLGRGSQVPLPSGV